MKKISIAFLALCSFVGVQSCKNNTSENSDTQAIASTAKFVATQDMVAKIYTSKGNIEVGLEYIKAPMTVANFVALAEGTMKNVQKPLGKPYYDGLIFHRMVPNFMIQGGCPSGTGTGNAGYTFSDEFHPDLRHDDEGVLSMANSGPNSNSSQFFITHNSTPWLDGIHSVFGKVIKGMDIVNKIAPGDRIDSIRIIRNTAEAKAFDAPNVFETQKSIQAEKQKAEEANKFGKYQSSNLYKVFEEFVKKSYPNATKTASGLYYVKTTTTNGPRATANSQVKVHYKGMLTNGKIFDQSIGKAPLDFVLGQGMVIPGWDEGIALLNVGEKATLIIPAYLAYGEQGVPGAILPNETLIFEVQLLAVN
jgi:cyclophilin family peptidyl-prolyl cis-trans isomerase